MVDKNFWKQALGNAEAERTALLEERQRIEDELGTRRNQIDQQVVQLEQTIATLGPLARDHVEGIDPAVAQAVNQMAKLELDDTSLANSCREVLKASDAFMTPVQVKSALIKAGYDEGRHTNLGASVHSVLKRLVQAGEVIPSTDPYQNAVYKWNTSAFKHSPLKHIGQRPKWREHMNKAKKKS